MNTFDAAMEIASEEDISDMALSADGKFLAAPDDAGVFARIILLEDNSL